MPLILAFDGHFGMEKSPDPCCEFMKTEAWTLMVYSITTLTSFCKFVRQNIISFYNFKYYYFVNLQNEHVGWAWQMRKCASDKMESGEET